MAFSANRHLRRSAYTSATILVLLCMAYTSQADYEESPTVFDRRDASKMPYANSNTTSAVIADRYLVSALRCSMLCSETAGSIAFFYSNALQRCRLLRDITLPSTADEELYIIVSGGFDAINIALYKPAYASSEHYSGSYPASRAVDGKLSTILHTNCTESYPWLLLDLQYVYRVTEVTIYTSCHCCYNRMHDIDVRLGNTSTPVPNISGGSAFFQGALCYHRTGAFTTCSPGETYSCATGVIGRYLTVQVTISSSEKCFQPSEVVVKGELLTI